jgi:hypothetical protein
VGRQATQRIRIIVVAATATLAACGQPPASTAADASVADASAGDAPVDARLAFDALVADTSVVDAAFDASMVDGAVDATVPPDALLTNTTNITLVDVTLDTKLVLEGGRVQPDPWGLGSGAAFGDIDGNGTLDVVIARCDSQPPAPAGGPSELLRNTGMGAEYPVLEPDTDFAAMFAGRCGHGVALGDYDRDGDLDVFITMDGTDGLFENDGTGSFTDVTVAAGVGGPPSDRNTGPVFADINADGQLDLLVPAHTMTLPPDSDPLNANRLYVNLGDGTFRDVSVSSGFAADASSQSIMVTDLDNDGAMEIYIANDRFAVNGGNPTGNLEPDAYHDPVAFDDEGMPTYVDRTDEYNTDLPRSAMGLALADLNRDGFDDIYVSDWGFNHLQIWSDAEGKYAQVAGEWNLEWGRNPASYNNVSWGARFLDLDRDGREELLFVNGYISDSPACQTFTQMDYYLRRHPTDDVFGNITPDTGIEWEFSCPPSGQYPITGRGAVIGDIDSDGDDDLIITPYIEQFRFYRNDTPQSDRHRVRVRPVGTVSAVDPAGAVLEVTRLDASTGRQTLYAGGDALGHSDRVLEVGIDSETTITDATLHWPSGYSQRIDLLAGFAIDATLEITEPAWLTLSERVVSSIDPAPILVYQPADAAGDFLGAAGSGRTVTGVRSDGQPIVFIDGGNGTYTAAMPHPGTARITVVTITDDAVELRPRLTVNYQ